MRAAKRRGEEKARLASKRRGLRGSEREKREKRKRGTRALEKEVSGEVGVWLHDRAGPSGISRSAVARPLVGSGPASPSAGNPVLGLLPLFYRIWFTRLVLLHACGMMAIQ